MITPSAWTKGCSVVSSNYYKDSQGNILYNQKQSYDFYKTIQTNLGGKETQYESEKGTRHGFIFNSKINRKMQYIY